jgi:hypothetical protein
LISDNNAYLIRVQYLSAVTRRLRNVDIKVAPEGGFKAIEVIDLIIYIQHSERHNFVLFWANWQQVFSIDKLPKVHFSAQLYTK